MSALSVLKQEQSNFVPQFHSVEPDVKKAIHDILAQVHPKKGDSLVLFLSPSYPLEEFLEYSREKLPCKIYGCTTSGEIGQFGYTDQSLSGFLMPLEHFDVVPNLYQFEHGDISKSEDKKSQKFNNCFTIALIEGLSVMEEKSTSAFFAKNHSPLVGGSAGDDVQFKATFIINDGQSYQNAGLFLSCSTNLKVNIFKSQHFEPSETRLVTTRTDPSRRIVYEINGRPAAVEYSRLIGCDTEQLTPEMHAMHPVVMKIGSEYYIRSILQASEDLSLTFACAISDGMVLRLAKGKEIISSVEKLVEGLCKDKAPEATIIFECILRKLELERLGLKNESANAMKELNPVGFHTYGEQMNGVHINQTISGLAFYSEEDNN